MENDQNDVCVCVCVYVKLVSFIHCLPVRVKMKPITRDRKMAKETEQEKVIR